MSDVLRDMIVSIDFKGVDTRRLLGLNNQINQIEESLQDAGAEIEDVTNNVNNLGNNSRRQLRGTLSWFQRLDDGIERVSSSTSKLPNSLKKIGGAATVGIGIATGAAMGLVGALSKVYTETEKTFSYMEARTGASGTELQGLKDVANGLYRDGFGESLDQVATDLSKVRVQFRDLNDRELSKLTEGMYTIGALWGADVSEISRTTKNMVNSFKDLTATDALNLMQVSFQKTGDYSGDLLDTFNEYSGYFADMGFSAREFANILVKASSAGAWNLDKAGDSVKEFGNLAREYGGTATDAFKAIGLDGKHMAKQVAQGGEVARDAFAATIAGLAAMKDPVKQQAAGVALFGGTWEDLRKDVILAMGSATDEIGYYGDAVEKATAITQDNVSTKMTQSFREMKGAAIDAFMNNGGPDFVSTMTDKVVELIPELMQFIEKTIEIGNVVYDNWEKVNFVIESAKFPLKSLNFILSETLGFFNAIGTAMLNPMDTIKGIGSGILGGLGKAKNFIMGSHANGLENVPFDGYTAELHKNEAVLTGSQSNFLRDMGILKSNGKRPTIDVGNVGGLQTSPNGSNTTFAPTVQVNVTASPGENGDSLANKISSAVSKEMENYFRKLNMQLNN